MHTIIFGNTLEAWLIAFAYVVGTLILAKALYWFMSKVVKRLVIKTRGRLDDILLDMLEEPIVLSVILLGMWHGYDELQVGEQADKFAGEVFRGLITVNITWLIVRVIDAIMTEYLTPFAERRSETMAKQFMPIIRKSLRTMLWIIGIIIALSNAGYNVGALLAGLGIGGIALAMAAKDFVANIFGGLTVFTDKPFMVGDRIQIDGFDGTVKEIGIRSTRITTLAGRIVTIPNHKFTDSYVENVSIEPTRKVNATLGLTYDTTPEQMEKAISIVKAIIIEENGVTNNCYVWFAGFGDFSMNINLIYYIEKEGDLFEVPNRINLSVLRKFNAEGLEFAFPTQTIYHQAID